MSDSSEFCPIFENPPVYETRLGVQFTPLHGIRSGHFGLFWAECLDLGEWKIQEDQTPLPRESERFDHKLMKPPMTIAEEPIPEIRMRLVNKKATKFVQFQGNKLVYSWTAEDGKRPQYAVGKEEFIQLFSKLSVFAEKYGLRNPHPNLWEVTYTNQIPQGELWQKPTDWHKIFPSLFSYPQPEATGHEWGSFDGSWFFEIVPQRGRVRVKFQKSIMRARGADPNLGGELVLLFVLTARGEIGGTGAPDFVSGFDIGHRSALRLFHDLASSEAREKWGIVT